MEYLKIRTADNSFDARFIEEALATEGITSIVTNETFTALMPHLNGMLGSGIQILVHKDDFNRATEILQERDKRDVACCPNCNSTNVKYGLGTKGKLKRLVALLIAVLVASPTRHIRQTHYCRDCKHEFVSR